MERQRDRLVRARAAVELLHLRLVDALVDAHAHGLDLRGGVRGRGVLLSPPPCFLLALIEAAIRAYHLER